MSETYETPTPDPMGGPRGRPNGDGLPPVDGGLNPPGRGDSVDPGMPGEGGDRGEDVGGGMSGEG